MTASISPIATASRRCPRAAARREAIVLGADFRSVSTLPARGGVLYSRGRPQSPSTILLHTFDGREDAPITEGLTPRFIAPDLLLFVRGNDSDGRTLSMWQAAGWLTEPVRLVGGIAVLTTAAQYDVSGDGTLVYLPSNRRKRRTLVVDECESGWQNHAVLHDTDRSYSDPRLSPDGKRIALHLSDQENDIWVLDIARRAMTRITFDAREDETPVWSPDGQWIAFAGYLRDGSQNRAVFLPPLRRQRGEEVIWQNLNHSHVTDWSPDGKSILIEVARSHAAFRHLPDRRRHEDRQTPDCDPVQRIERAGLTEWQMARLSFGRVGARRDLRAVAIQV